jgi:hypothetical protein
MRKSEQMRPYPPAYMTADELAFWLCCSSRTVEAYSKVNLLPAPLRVGNLVRWRWTDVEQHIAAQNRLAEGSSGDNPEADEYSGDIIRLRAKAARQAGQEADGRSA